MIKVVHFSDLHFGSGERYGSINPETGLNKRFEDFISALDKAVDFSVGNNVDLVIFTGDTYKNATPEPVYQKEFAKRIKNLSNSKIPTLLLIGNHDILYRADGSDALDIYNTLEVDHVTVFNKIEKKDIATKNGTVQIISLPHVTKSRLLTKEEHRNLGAKEQDQLMIEKVNQALEACFEKIDPVNPAILIGHGTIETVQFGSEQDLSIGKVLSYPLSFFKRKEIDYVGFGHIHRHQILNDEKPLVLYAGSLERVDFGEENEDKGFICLEIERGNVKHEFISTNPRPFITISVDLTNSSDPQSELERAIIKNKKSRAVIRVKYKIDEENFGVINNEKIKSLLSDSFSYVLQPEIVHKERTYRIADLDVDMITNPLSALDKYLFDCSEEEKKTILEKAKSLIDSLE